MAHLSREQKVDAAEGRGEPGMLVHAASCEECRRSIDELRDMLALVQTDRVPEPSPLFWDHLASRIRADVRDDVHTRGRLASWVWRWGPASALGAAALVVALVVTTRGPFHAGPGAPASSPTSPAAAAAVETEDLAQADDASWILVRELSREISADEAGAALPAGPGTADRALGHLDEAERAALGAIIREEMARAADPGAAPSNQ